MGAPWDPDRTLSIDDAEALIKSSMPAIESRGVTLVGSGWEFDAYVTTDGWVVRFPRRAEGANLFERDQRVTEIVAGFLTGDVSVPRIEIVAEPTRGFPYPFAAHRLIAGVPVDEIRAEFVPLLARQIAAALGGIHSVPERAARAAGVESAEGNEASSNEWIRSNLTILSQIRDIDPTVARAVTWAGQTRIPDAFFKGPLRFIHQDLSPDHLLADPDTGRLTGIIDWTDAMLGDAARDFVFLVAWRGWSFAEEVLRHYPHQVDEGFRDRLRFMARLLTPIWLALAVQRGTEVEKLTQWVHNAYAPEVHAIAPRSKGV
jgi:aminoglycoside phosphotransferase (APT) family kinase protein